MGLEQEFDSSKFLLTAINVLLQAIGELPVEDEAEASELEEAKIALSTIIEAKKEILSEGWDFNQDKDYTFPIDLDGYISIPVNVLDISSTDGDLIMRDWRLYSKSNQSAIFDEAQNVNVIWDIEFNNLTHPIRNFITLSAARKFQARTIMDPSIYSYTQVDEDKAMIVARRSDGRTGNYNMLSSGMYGPSALARL